MNSASEQSNDQFQQMIDDLCAKVEQGISARVQIVSVGANTKLATLTYSVRYNGGEPQKYTQQFPLGASISSGELMEKIKTVESAVRSMGYNVEIAYDEQSLCIGSQDDICPPEAHEEYETDSEDDVYEIRDSEVVEEYDELNVTLADLVRVWIRGNEPVVVSEIEFLREEGAVMYSFRAEGDHYTLDADAVNGDAPRCLGRKILEACSDADVKIDKQGNLYVS